MSDGYVLTITKGNATKAIVKNLKSTKEESAIVEAKSIIKEVSYLNSWAVKKKNVIRHKDGRIITTLNTVESEGL